MTTLRQSKTKIPFLFLKEGLKGLRTQGSLVPSSKYLAGRISKRIVMKKGIVIVELGAGTGVFTEMILSRLPQDGILLAFEVNHKLAEHLKKTIKDKKLIVIEDDATLIGEYLSRFSLQRADCIVSGLPLGDFARAKRQRLLSAIHASLDDDGLYIQFQYFLTSLLHIRTMFDARIIGYELRNIPPAFLYECRKRATLIP